MALVHGPLFSMDASGTIGNAITFSKWKGRAYVRERVIPSNPKSGGQTGRRSMFRFLSQVWTDVITADRATWDDLADQIVASDFNAYMKLNMQDWHNFLAPSKTLARARTNTPSDNALTAAVWEENRIKLTIAGSALGDNWGLAIFAKEGSAVTPTVGNAITADADTTIASHDVFWTPPSVATWHFDTIAFADDGAQAAAGGGQNAAPP